jgi:NMD protein affecting ribosome stability and mRNA decay
MALQSCYECGKEISSKAIMCPQCGAPQNPASDLVDKTKGFFSKRKEEKQKEREEQEFYERREEEKERREKEEQTNSTDDNSSYSEKYEKGFLPSLMNSLSSIFGILLIGTLTLMIIVLVIASTK